ncbi:hypothetical protein BDZ91DRAFT_745629 [Kalaharituber pfeilii]|nr:hypothetical protein BDZ91DRAFT_745629 [Kalaharituber pfeilii]
MRDLYIPAKGMAHPHDSNRFNLLQAVGTFLSDAVPQQVCLIEGIAGYGKSTFNHYLARQLWSEYAHNETTAVIPLFISLFRVYSLYTRNGKPRHDSCFLF